MKSVMILFGLLLLGGCTSFGQNGDPLPQITFNHVKAYPLYVASYGPVGLEVGRKPEAPVGFLADPEKIVYEYLNSRYEAAGSQGKIVAKIRSVDIAHERVNSKNAIGAFIGLDHKDHYRVSVVLDLSAHGVGGIDWQKQSLTVYRDIYISEHVSLVEREKLEMRAMDHMIDDLDIALRKILNDRFGVLRPRDIVY
jgi:hypothetical protein